jgi:hypothetical protein
MSARLGGLQPYHRRLDGDPQAIFRKEPAGDHRADGEHSAERAVEPRIRRRRRLPEVVERGLKGQAGQVVDCGAKRDDREVLRERGHPNGAVDRDHRPGVIQHRLDRAAVDDDNPLGDPRLRRDPLHRLGPVDKPIIQRVQFDQEARVPRRVAREGRDDLVDRRPHPAARRVEPDLVVAIELQRKDKHRSANVG